MTLVEFCDYIESVGEESGSSEFLGAETSTYFFDAGLSDFPLIRSIFLRDFGLEFCNYPNLDEIDVENTKFFRWLYRQVHEYLLEADYQAAIISILAYYPELLDAENIDLDYLVNKDVGYHMTLVEFCDLTSSAN